MSGPVGPAGLRALGAATAGALAVSLLPACSDDSPLRGGDAFRPVEGAPRLALLSPPSVPLVPKGSVRVVASGPVTSRQLVPIIVRNGLDRAVRFPVVTGRSRTPSGKATTGESQLLVPDQLAPGAVTIGYVYFRTAPAAGEAVSFSVRQGDAPPAEAATVDLPIEGLAMAAGRVTGTLRNVGGRAAGLLSVTLVCSGADGRLLDARTAPPERSVLAGGETTRFAVDLDPACVGVIAGAQGSSSALATSAELDAPSTLGPAVGPSSPTLGPAPPSTTTSTAPGAATTTAATTTTSPPSATLVP